MRPRPRAARNRPSPDFAAGVGSIGPGAAGKIGVMRKGPVIILVLAAALVVGSLAAVRSVAVPLGVRGEWEWLRVPFGPNLIDLALAGLGVLAFAGFAGLGLRSLSARSTVWREALWVSSLAVVSVATQGVVQTGAPPGYGLAKWVVALHQRGASGYFTLAKEHALDTSKFLAGYPDWIKTQDSLHVGTHPPGLIVGQSLLLRFMERSPGPARFVEDHAPESAARMFRYYEQVEPLGPVDRATLLLTGFMTLVACGVTVVPLYALARAGLSAPGAWAVAALWPLAPSAVLFQPTADTAFPLLSTTALALAAASARSSVARGRWLAAASGVVLGVGMQLSLVFLAVGVIVALMSVFATGKSLVEKGMLVAATGGGFLAVTLGFWLFTGANPFVIWWWNQKNHARFYVEHPRTYRAWLVVDTVELAVGLGLPAAVWALAAARRPREFPRVSLATLAVLAALAVGGRSLSEVARLWLPFLPALLVASGFALTRSGGGPKTLAGTAALTGLQTLALQAMIQVVYPV
jgi:hypothetical protein